MSTNQSQQVSPSQRGGTIITFANQKGGVGKTATTANLAMLLSLLGLKVLAIDMDPQGHLGVTFGYMPDNLSRTIYDVFIGNTSIDQVILPTFVDPSTRSFVDANAKMKPDDAASPTWSQLPTEQARRGPDFAPINFMANRAEDILRRRPTWGTLLRKTLSPLRQRYDYILIDTNPSLGCLTVQSLFATDYVVIPIKPEKLSAVGLKQLLETIREAQEDANPDLKIAGVVSTQVQNYRSHRQVDSSLRAALPQMGIKIFTTDIRQSARFADAANQGTIIVVDDPRSEQTRAYWFLLAELLDVVGGLGRERPEIQQILTLLHTQKAEADSPAAIPSHRPM